MESSSLALLKKSNPTLFQAILADMRSLNRLFEKEFEKLDANSINPDNFPKGGFDNEGSWIRFRKRFLHGLMAEISNNYYNQRDGKPQTRSVTRPRLGSTTKSEGKYFRNCKVSQGRLQIQSESVLNFKSQSLTGVSKNISHTNNNGEWRTVVKKSSVNKPFVKKILSSSVMKIKWCLLLSETGENYFALNDFADKTLEDVSSNLIYSSCGISLWKSKVWQEQSGDKIPEKSQLNAQENYTFGSSIRSTVPKLEQNVHPWIVSDNSLFGPLSNQSFGNVPADINDVSHPKVVQSVFDWVVDEAKVDVIKDSREELQVDTSNSHENRNEKELPDLSSNEKVSSGMICEEDNYFCNDLFLHALTVNFEDGIAFVCFMILFNLLVTCFVLNM